MYLIRSISTKSYLNTIGYLKKLLHECQNELRILKLVVHKKFTHLTVVRKQSQFVKQWQKQHSDKPKSKLRDTEQELEEQRSQDSEQLDDNIVRKTTLIVKKQL